MLEQNPCFSVDWHFSSLLITPWAFDQTNISLCSCQVFLDALTSPSCDWFHSTDKEKFLSHWKHHWNGHICHPTSCYQSIFPPGWQRFHTEEQLRRLSLEKIPPSPLSTTPCSLPQQWRVYFHNFKTTCIIIPVTLIPLPGQFSSVMQHSTNIPPHITSQQTSW